MALAQRALGVVEAVKVLDQQVGARRQAFAERGHALACDRLDLAALGGAAGRPVRLLHMGDIPADTAVREAVMRRQLLLQSMPGSPAALAVAQLANKIQSALLS